MNKIFVRARPDKAIGSYVDCRRCAIYRMLIESQTE